MSPPALPPLLSLPFPQATGPDTVSYYAPPPGAYAIDVFGFGDETDFELEAVLAPAAPPLHKEDAAVLEKVAAACCPAGDAAACPVLRSALAAAAGGGKEAEGAAASDLCSRPPNACDADGRLTRLALAGEGLACRFPADLGRLPRLTALDLTANALHGDWASDVGPVLRALAPRLEAAHLSLNKLEGRLTCDLVGGEGEEGRPSRGGLRILALTGNRASGTLPACLFAGPVRELYAARNELGGSLPPIPADSPLARVALSDQGGPSGGFTGALPDLGAARGLVSLHADGGRLSGPLPPDLPPALTDLALARNRLTGPIPAGWCQAPAASALEVFDAEENELEGPLPPGLAGCPALLRLSLGRNRLHGELPPLFSPALEHLSAPFNRLTGPLPPGLGAPPGLALVDLQGNRLSGSLASFAERLEASQGQRRSLARYLNLGGNGLSGPLPPGLAAAGALAPGAWATTSPDHGLIGKTFNLSGNALSGPLPAWAVAAAVGAKDAAVGLAGNDWDCPDLAGGGGGGGGGSGGGALDWDRVLSAALPRSALAGVDCVRGGGDSGGGADRDGRRVALASLFKGGQAAGAAEEATPTGGGRGGEDVDAAPTTPSATRDRASGGRLVRPPADDGADVDRPDTTPAGGGDGDGDAPPRPAAGAGRGDPHLVRPGDGDDDDDGRKAAARSHSHDDDDDHDHDRDDEDKHEREGHTHEHEHDDKEHEHDHHHTHSGSSLTRAAAAIAVALAAAAATLHAARTALPSFLAAIAARRWAPASVPLAGLGAFGDDGGWADAEHLDGSGMMMELGGVGGRPKPPPGGGGDPAAAPSRGPVIEMKARAGGPPVGPVIDATGGGGGIGAYRPPAPTPEEGEEGGAAAPAAARPPRPPPPPPEGDPFV